MPLQQRVLFLVFFPILSALAQNADRIAVSLLPETTLQSRLDAGLVPYGQRENAIASLFREAGCTVELQKVTGKANNVICTLRGASSDPIVVGAHLDYITAGQGIIDDWSGAALLVSLYQSLKNTPRNHTFVFIAFAKEEEGLIGSRKYVHELDKEQRANIRAYINLECLGTNPTKIWIRRSSPQLLDSIARVASVLKTSVSGMDVDQVGDDDTHPFKDAQIPVLSIHSLDQKTFTYLHSKRDRMEALQMAYYSDSYRLIAFFLAYLDSIS